MYALMIVDMQNDFVKKLPPELVHALAERTNRLIEVFSALALPIYVVITEHKPDGSDALQKARDERDIPAVKGSAGAQLVEGLTIPSSASFLSKTKYSAFFGTDADQLLQDFSGTLVIAGVNTHACVRASAVDACQRDRIAVFKIAIKWWSRRARRPRASGGPARRVRRRSPPAGARASTAAR